MSCLLFTLHSIFKVICTLSGGHNSRRMCIVLQCILTHRMVLLQDISSKSLWHLFADVWYDLGSHITIQYTASHQHLWGWVGGTFNCYRMRKSTFLCQWLYTCTQSNNNYMYMYTYIYNKQPMFVLRLTTSSIGGGARLSQRFYCSVLLDKWNPQEGPLRDNPIKLTFIINSNHSLNYIVGTFNGHSSSVRGTTWLYVCYYFTCGRR